jgi:2-oxoglutarate dehydrogenase E2 component (dihydrolipoamide succinyltransferase)
MLVDIIMPKMGESIMDGRILKWYKQLGDTIAKDETLFEISTDKVDTEVPSAEGGILVEILFNEGDTANVGDVVARIETEPLKAKVKKGTPVQPTAKDSIITESSVDKAVSETMVGVKKALEMKVETGFYSPLVMNIAQKEGISMDELANVKGTGAGGRIRKQDILAYVELRKTKQQLGKTTPDVTQEKKITLAEIKAPDLSGMYGKPGIEVIAMDTIQERMAEHMLISIHTSPHVSAVAECDMSAVDKARKQLADEFMKNEGFKLTYMPFICDAVVKALRDFPLINSSIDGTKILKKNYINLGIAVAMDEGGLIVPVIKNADSMSLTGFARAINDLAKRARIKKLKLDEIQDGTFSITNYGLFGNDIGTPLINQPQIAILGIGTVKKRAVVIANEQGDSIAIKPTVFLTLSFDHRLIDGALGGKFLMKIVEYLETYSL